MKILSILTHYDRVMCLVALLDSESNKVVVPMYRSTGKAGVKGAWFPFAGIALEKEDQGYKSQLYPWLNLFDNDSGWIVKMGCKIHLNETTAKAKFTHLGDLKISHKDVDNRLNPVTDIGVDFKVVSEFLGTILDNSISHNLFTNVNEEGVNRWIKETSKEYLLKK